MNQNLWTHIKKILQERQVYRRWRAVVSCLAIIVVLGTMYALILPAKTIETEGHTHDDSCYSIEKTLTCGKEESANSEEDGIEGHTHTEDCYTEEKKLICTKTEQSYENYGDDDNNEDESKVLVPVAADIEDGSDTVIETEVEFGQFITKVTYDSSKDMTYDDVKDTYSMTFDMAFKIPTGKLSADKTYSYTLPEGVTVLDSLLDKVTTITDQNLKTEAYDTWIEKDTDGKYILKVKYKEEYVDKLIKRGSTVTNGTINFKGTVEASKLNDKDQINFTEKVTLTVKTGDFDYSENTDGKNDITVSKTGGTLSATEDTITYTITVSSKKGTPGVVNLEDVISLVVSGGGSLEITDAKLVSAIKYNSSDNTGTAVNDITITNKDNNTYFTSELPQLGAGESYVLTMTYTLKDVPANFNGTAKNKITATTNVSDDVTLTSVDTCTTTLKRQTLSKTSENGFKIVNGEGRIDWEITVNEPGTNIAGKELTDTMFSEAKELVVKKWFNGTYVNAVEGVDYKIDSDNNNTITFLATADGKNNNTYMVTYYTPQTQTNDSQKVTNTASFDDVTAESEVTVGADQNSSLEKTFVSVKQVSGSAFTMEWNLSVTVPSAGLSGLTITDTVYDKNKNVNSDRHWISGEQLDDLKAAIIGAINTDASSVIKPTDVTIKVSDDGKEWNEKDITSGRYVYFQIVFSESLGDKLYAGNSFSFNYCTTGNTTGVYDGENYHNRVDSGGKSDTASYTYQKKVVKLNQYCVESDSYVSENTGKFEGNLEWYVKVTPDSIDYSSFTITDTLPVGVEIVKVGIGTEGWSAAGNTVGNLSETKKYIENDTGVSVSLTNGKTSDGKDVQIITTEVSGEKYIKEGTPFYIYYMCNVPNSTSLAAGTYTYNNGVVVTADGEEYGSDSRTETVIIKEEEKKENTSENTSKNIKKSGSWSSNRPNQVDYTVTINPNGGEVNGGNPFEVKDELYYTFGQNEDVYLDYGSVILYEIKDDGSTKQLSSSDWKWTVKEDPEALSSTILATVPDKTKLILVYSYKINVTNPSYDKFWGNLYNTATITGTEESTGQITTHYGAENSSMSGTSDSNATYEITKVDSENSGKVLPGAVFTLYKVGLNGADDEEKRSYTTDSDGKAYIIQDDEKQIIEDNALYYIIETTAPSGYKLSDERNYFYISATGKTVTIPSGVSAVDLSSAHKPLIIKDESNQTSIAVKKVWKDQNENVVSDPSVNSISFDLYQVENTTSPDDSSGSDTGVTFKAYNLFNDIKIDKSQENIAEGDKVRVEVSVRHNLSGISRRIIDPDLDGLEIDDTDSGNSQPWTFGRSSTYTVTAYVTKPEVKISLNYATWDVSVSITKISDLGAELVDTYTISSSDNWQKTISGLPKTGINNDNETVYYTYYVKERSVNGYISTVDYGSAENSISSGDITITNTENGEKFTSLTINKEWKKSNGEEVTPTETKIRFQLWQVKQPATGEKESECFDTYTIYAMDNWTCTVENLPVNEVVDGKETATYSYYVVETTGLEDYDSSCNYGDENNTTISSEITITNTKKDVYELPETGGNGRWPYAVGGVLLALSAGILLYRKKLIVK
jgi:LPXTG-motif cell wall-anchored protein